MVLAELVLMEICFCAFKMRWKSVVRADWTNRSVAAASNGFTSAIPQISINVLNSDDDGGGGGGGASNKFTSPSL